jgi:hypothetical protein
MASYRLTFGASLIGALINVVFGGIVAWVLVRYKFPGKRIVDALVDLPFAAHRRGRHHADRAVLGQWLARPVHRRRSASRWRSRRWAWWWR